VKCRSDNASTRVGTYRETFARARERCMISGCDSQHKDEKIHRNHESVFSNKGRFEWLGTRVAHSHTRVRVSSTTLLRCREVVELRVVPTAASRSEGWRVLAHDVRSPRRARADETCRCVFRSISASIIGEAYNLFPTGQISGRGSKRTLIEKA
jgi:hypothetical protein